MTPYYEHGGVTIYHGDCREVLPTLAQNSVDLVLTDPPYFRVKSETWDRQWSTPKAFLGWLDGVCAEFHRVTKPNGSLYCFASPQMSARVEVQIAERFNVLNHIVWRKDSSRHRQAEKEALRGFFPQTERIVFAEQYGADNTAKGEAGYVAQCDDLRGFVFEPIRSYLDGERLRAGVAHRAVIAHLGMTGHDSHFFSVVQWKLPLPDQYALMRELFNAKGGEYLRKDYEYLRKDYEDLRKDYEDLRRPFSVTADVPYTDVWDFAPVAAYPDKHPCEKPQPMLRHMIQASSRPSAVVLDAFAGTGSTLLAASALGRCAIGVEIHERYCEIAAQRLQQDTLLLEATA
jgi:adenine-specific DNA-methyltransferase